MDKRGKKNRNGIRRLCMIAVLLLITACGKKEQTGAELPDSSVQEQIGQEDEKTTGGEGLAEGEDAERGENPNGSDRENDGSPEPGNTDGTDKGQAGEEGSGQQGIGAENGQQGADGMQEGQSRENGTVRNGQQTGEGQIPEEQRGEEGSGQQGIGAENGQQGADGTQNDRNTGTGDGGGQSAGMAGGTAAPQPAAAGTTPYGAHGALSVSGTQLVDTYGAPYQLRGVSTHGLSWFPQYADKEAFRTMRDEWGVNVVRLAMYTAEYGGYCVGDENNRNRLKQLVYDSVDAAAELGMYVIVDWHVLNDRDPNIYTDQAADFFRETAERYASYGNVIYEICNEPNGGVSWQSVKRYAEQIIPVIREQDADAVIIVGTPTWSQDVDKAAADPITGYQNIMYALHFYADTHRDSLRQKMVNAIGAGLPVFVSEYGICDASGNGAVNVSEADRWVSVMDENGVSYCIWNLSNKSESSALLRSSVTATSGWSYEDLSDSGKWFVDMMGADHAAIGSTSGGAGTPNDGGNGSAGSGTAQSVTSDASDALQVSLSLSNSWETDGKHYYQYSLEVKNRSGAKVNGWTCEISFDRGVSVSQSWCGIFSVSGSSVTITPETYNAAIEAGASQGNIGFILEAEAALNVTGVSCQ